MKQVLQSLRDGSVDLTDVPAPRAKPGELSIHTTTTLVSAGTERMLVEFGKAGWISKARQQPDKVKVVLEKVLTDGLATTLNAVKSKLDQPLALGYCNVGRVTGPGAEVEGFAAGDRVVSNGKHAEIVVVPKNLCARIPDTVSDEAASFTVLAAIGLQGIRLTRPTLGECVVVTGLGLIGLLTVQMLRAHGCRVLAIDFDQERLDLARKFGAEVVNARLGGDVLAAAAAFSRGAGVDAVIITASTKSSEPVAQAAQMCRKRGRIVLVGVAGLELNRADFYEKELTFQVSCSYGPGRYDSAYEEGGNDYPIGFVRWTEQRNFEAVLDMMSSGVLDVLPLITHRFEIEDAAVAYAALTDDKKALGIILTYDSPAAGRMAHTVSLRASAAITISPQHPVVGFIGAGNYASRVLIPAFRKAGATLHTISSTAGVSGVVHGRKTGFSRATTDTDALIVDPAINAVAIATRHDTHAVLTIRALESGKHVFVEKPLALTQDEVTLVEAAHAASGCHLLVGFNRRFAPHVQTMKRLLEPVLEPKSFVMVLNAGAIPPDHWTQDPNVGGGRIIGEACHYVDLMRFLAGAPIVSIQARRMGNCSMLAKVDDKASITLGFEDGSFGTIHYLANGASSFPKERIEVFVAGRTLQLNNFVKMRGFGWPGFQEQFLWRQDKGQAACAAAFLGAIVTGGPTPIPPDELFEVARATIEAAEQLRAQ